MRCYDCNETQFSETRGEIVCLNCGLVVEQNTILQETLLPRGAFATHPALLQAGTFNTNGKKIKASWLLSTKQKNYQKLCNEIGLLASRVSVPHYAATEAKRLLLETSNRDLGIGRKGIHIAYACVYLSCIDAGIPRTALELTAHTDVTQNDLLAAANLIHRKLKLHPITISAVDLIPRFATRLQLTSQAVTKALEYASSQDTGIKPSTTAACCLYLAMKHTGGNQPQRIFTRYTGVMEATLRRRSKQLQKKLT